MAFHFVKQADSMQGGIACVSMICRHFGKRLSLQSLEDWCHPTKEGVSLKGIADLCDTLHLDYTAGKVDLEGLCTCPLPAILHWDQNHFVVLYRIGRNGKRFHIADPAKGKYSVSPEELGRHWISIKSGDTGKGIAMFFSRTERFDRLVADSAGGRRSFGVLFRYI